MGIANYERITQMGLICACIQFQTLKTFEILNLSISMQIKETSSDLSKENDKILSAIWNLFLTKMPFYSQRETTKWDLRRAIFCLY